MSKRVLIADVAEASDGVETVEKFDEHTPDLVTLDIVMPRKNGIDALREILAAHPTACIVMCSALGQEALVAEALESGARDFIVKPFKPEQVRTVVDRALHKGT